jgi:nitroreductase
VTFSGEWLDLLRGRRSVRKFQDREVSREVLADLIGAAEWAPSAGNRQDWFFTVVTTPARKKEMADAVRARWKEIVEKNRDMGFIGEVEQYSAHFAAFERAPAVIVVSAANVKDFERQMLGDDAEATSGGATSAAMAAQNLMLAAHAQGLGTCCMTGALAARAELASIVKLAKRRQVVCLIAVGYPDEDPPPPGRKPADGISEFL